MKSIIRYFILAVFALSACQNNNNTSHDTHDHSHDDVSIQLTRYTKNYEIFAEAQPMVAGQTGGILTHITKLESFKPLPKGKVTVSLIIGSKGIRQTLDKPTRPGIYLFQLQPEVAGKGKLIFDIETGNEKLSITFNGIEVFYNEHDAIHAAEHHATNHPDAITFTKEQSWKINFESAYPAIETFGEILKTSAKIHSAPSEEITLSAHTSGVVQFNKKQLSIGTPVAKGLTLFTISTENLADNNMNVRYNEAKNNFEKAEANYKRKSILAADQLVSQKDLSDSKTEYENAKLSFENLQKNFNPRGQNVVSSKSGFATHIYVSNGQFVEAGDALLSIAENDNLVLVAEVQQKYAAALPHIKTAKIRSTEGTFFTLEELNGKVVSYSKNVSDESYLIPVTLQVENRPSLIPGSFTEVFIETQNASKALTVPNSALIEEQGNFSVFVQLTPESFEKREVITGKTNGFKTEIKNGLKPSDRIVTQGAILIKLAAVSNSLDPHAGHVH